MSTFTSQLWFFWKLSKRFEDQNTDDKVILWFSSLLFITWFECSRLSKKLRNSGWILIILFQTAAARLYSPGCFSEFISIFQNTSWMMLWQHFHKIYKISVVNLGFWPSSGPLLIRISSYWTINLCPFGSGGFSTGKFRIRSKNLDFLNKQLDRL